MSVVHAVLMVVHIAAGVAGLLVGPFAIALGTELAAAAGWQAGRRRRPGWRGRQVRLICGSYVSLVTALFVVTWGSLPAWVLPTVIGTVLVERAAHRASAEPVLTPGVGGPRRRSSSEPG